jgi:hypothetical protein
LTFNISHKIELPKIQWTRNLLLWGKLLPTFSQNCFIKLTQHVTLILNCGHRKVVFSCMTTEDHT